MITIQPPSEQETNHITYWLKPATIQFFVGLFIGTILGWFSHFLSNRRDEKKRITEAKDKFRVFVSQKIAAIPKEGSLRFYQTTKFEVRDAVFAIVPFVSGYHLQNLTAAWKAYEDAENGLNDESDEFNSLRSEALVQDGKQPIEISGKVLKKRLEDFLKVF